MVNWTGQWKSEDTQKTTPWRICRCWAVQWRDEETRRGWWDWHTGSLNWLLYPEHCTTATDNHKPYSQQVTRAPIDRPISRESSASVSQVLHKRQVPHTGSGSRQFSTEAERW